MKIDILSFHSQLNYGGVLQCRALQTLLEKMWLEVVVIDRWLTPGFHKRYILDYLEKVKRNIPWLDCTDCLAFEDTSLFFNSFFLNVRGRALFTRRVLMDFRFFTDHSLQNRNQGSSQ